MHKTAIFWLLNIKVVFISAFLTNMNINKYFVVVGIAVGLCLALVFDIPLYMSPFSQMSALIALVDVFYEPW